MTTFNDQPDIKRGLDCSVSYIIPVVSFDGLDPLACRIVIDFKFTPDQVSALTTVDTVLTPLQVTRAMLAAPDPNAGDINLTFNLTSAQTALMTKREILYDILAIAGLKKVLIAGMMAHQVYFPITVR